ncbi:MAG: YicC/YloC family endoribonuclease, partial [Planctomycetota bacterium]
MTGFGVASAEVDGARYVVEVRSLNSKYFKALVRLPEDLQGLEGELEPVLARRLSRGSVVLTVRFSDVSADAAARINAKALRQYLEQLQSAAGSGQGGLNIDMGAVLSLPGVVISDTGEALIERARPVLLGLVDKACMRVLAMRNREGVTLHDELHKHRRQIADRLAVIGRRAPEVVEQYRVRLRERIDALLAESSSALRDEDLIREVAVYAERSDITEEVARLQGHLEQFAEIIDAADEEPSGRTLDFLSQEMLREANTIASKCLDVEI